MLIGEEIALGWYFQRNFFIMDLFSYEHVLAKKKKREG